MVVAHQNVVVCDLQEYVGKADSSAFYNNRIDFATLSILDDMIEHLSATFSHERIDRNVRRKDR